MHIHGPYAHSSVTSPRLPRLKSIPISAPSRCLLWRAAWKLHASAVFVPRPSPPPRVSRRVGVAASSAKASRHGNAKCRALVGDVGRVCQLIAATAAATQDEHTTELTWTPPLSTSPSSSARERTNAATMQMKRSSVRTVFLVLFVCAYLVFGAIIFSLLEEKPEQALKVAVRHRRQQFLLNHSCVTGIATLFVVCHVMTQ